MITYKDETDLVGLNRYRRRDHKIKKEEIGGDNQIEIIISKKDRALNNGQKQEILHG